MENEWFNADKLGDLIAEKVLERLHAKESPKKLLDVRELSEALNVPKTWVYDRTRIKEGGIPLYKVGKYLRFDLDEVLKWIRENSEARWINLLVFRNVKSWNCFHPLIPYRKQAVLEADGPSTSLISHKESRTLCQP
jgi:excisionase family DNA binding protein